MYIELTPEQRHLQAEMRQYFATLISVDEAKEMEVDRHGKAYRELFQMVREQLDALPEPEPDHHGSSTFL